jgi:hypothetical protein
MPRCQPQIPLFSDLNESIRLSRRDGERLLEINVTSRLETEAGKREMGLRRRRNVNYVGRNGCEHFYHIGKALRNSATLTELLGHQQFPIAERDDPATGDAINGLHMLISNFPAAGNGYTKIGVAHRSVNCDKNDNIAGSKPILGFHPRRLRSF